MVSITYKSSGIFVLIAETGWMEARREMSAGHGVSACYVIDNKMNHENRRRRKRLE